MHKVKAPLVSVVIPYYNKKDTIKRSIQCVLNQSYTNWELIIVDDKGQEPLDWQENWNSLPIHLLLNEENLGVARSRQRGQDFANGEYIAFLDADDWWGDRFLEKCLEKLEQSTNAAGCYVNIIEVENGIERNRSSYSGLSNILNTIIAYRRPWQTSGILWRKNELGNWGNLKTHEDSWFEVMTSKKNNYLVYLRDVNCYYCHDGENHLSTYRGNGNVALDQQKLFLMIYDELINSLNFKYKVILYNRLIRGQLKIHEYCPEYNGEIGEQLMNLNPLLFWMRNQPFMLKIIHFILQSSPFKINF